MRPIDVTDRFDLDSLLQSHAQVLRPHHAEPDEGASWAIIGAS
jgi:hypothetical protein